MTNPSKTKVNNKNNSSKGHFLATAGQLGIIAGGQSVGFISIHTGSGSPDLGSAWIYGHISLRLGFQCY